MQNYFHKIDFDSIENVLLEDLLPNSKVLRQSGMADLKVSIVRSSEENQLDISAAILDWKINGQQLGQLKFNANGNTLMNAYEVKKIVTTCPHCFNTIKNEYHGSNSYLKYQYRHGLPRHQLQNLCYQF